MARELENNEIEEEMTEEELQILEAMKLFQKSPFAFIEETLGESVCGMPCCCATPNHQSNRFTHTAV